MTDIPSLKNSINQYEEQLSQVNLALSATAKGPDRDNLLSLQSDIRELINLTVESLENAKCQTTTNDENSDIEDTEDDPMAREYAIFKTELEQASKDSEATDNNDKAEMSRDIEDELKALEGMKCRAPHGSGWGGTGYHNAMVSCIHGSRDKISSINDIEVRVLFVNPTHKEMLPCPYYLDGACKFSDEQCHYSHGEVVPLSSLREYKEPIFSTIKTGSRVLAKEKNHLWHRCVILKLPEKDDDDHYRIKFESSGQITEVPVQNLLPLEDADLEMSDTSDDSDCERETNGNEDEEEEEEALIHKSLLNFSSNEPLGNWEQYTRGIGSKLMAQMGYIHGTGLGKRADGRIIPVEATVLPSGKSLDHCMELREHAGGEKDFFSADRKMRKQKLKMEQRREKQYLREKAREKSNVFNFINNTLGNKPTDESEASGSKTKNHFKTHTNRGLNVASFQISENISRLEKESSKLMDSLVRHSKGSLPYNNIVLQYNEKQSELAVLRSTQTHIATEQSQRKDKEKLSIF